MAASTVRRSTPPQYSSPAAKQETKDLNEQGVNGTTDVPRGFERPSPGHAGHTFAERLCRPRSDPATPPQATPQSSIAAPMKVAQNDPQQQYQNQQQQYQTQQQQYQDQQQQYQDQKQRYDNNLRQYDQAQLELCRLSRMSTHMNMTTARA